MILAAYICEHGAIVSQATNHATSPDGAGATLDSLLRARVQELSQVGGSAAVKRVMVRRHDEYLLFVLVQGAHAYVCACTNAPERAFAAFCFLAAASASPPAISALALATALPKACSTAFASRTT